jgi:hypothetical protein
MRSTQRQNTFSFSPFYTAINITKIITPSRVFVILYDEGYFAAVRNITLLLRNEINYRRSV